ncbi:MAG: hypothetical protein OXG05_06720 [Gammaproteobacteria bacterium]|nr:hypothetical protein [Gammaproteobacteria bacterium]
MNKARTAIAFVAAFCFVSMPSVLADGSVWLPTPGTGTMTVSYVSQSADKMWVGKNGPNPIPFRGLDQSTITVNGSYGFSDAVSMDLSIGRSEVSPKNGGPIPLSTDGLTDAELGVTWRFLDEVVTGGVSAAVRFGAILAGNYDVGGFGPAEVMGDPNRVGAGPTAIGDGASGIELSGIVGKIFNNRIAISAELGLRNRSGNVPRETFMNLDAHLITGERLVLSAQYHIQASSGDIDIGPPPGPGAHGMHWDQFPFVAEDINRVSLGGTVVLDSIDIGLHWFKVLDGRNTAEFDAFGGTLTYNFGH